MKLFVFLVFLLMFAVEVNASDCAGGETPYQSYWEAAVVMGTVSYSSPTTNKIGEYEQRGRLFRFAIERTFRGVKGTEVEVLTSEESGSRIQPGTKWS